MSKQSAEAAECKKLVVSSTEATYISAEETCRQLKWILKVMQEFGIEEPKPAKLFEDIQWYIKLAQTEEFNSET